MHRWPALRRHCGWDQPRPWFGPLGCLGAPLFSYPHDVGVPDLTWVLLCGGRQEEEEESDDEEAEAAAKEPKWVAAECCAACQPWVGTLPNGQPPPSPGWGGGVLSLVSGWHVHDPGSWVPLGAERRC